MNRHFADRQDALDFVVEHLGSAHVEGHTTSLATMIVSAFEEDVPLSAGAEDGTRVLLKAARWVIRDDDLGLMDAFGKILESAAAAGAIYASSHSLTATVIAPATAIATQVVKVARNAARKGVRLDDEDCFILALLAQSSSGFTTSQVASGFARRFDEIRASEVPTRLAKLAKYPGRHGDVSLVWQGEDKSWRLQGV